MLTKRSFKALASRALLKARGGVAAACSDVSNAMQHAKASGRVGFTIDSTPTT